MTFQYEVHGLVLGSNFPLPELASRRRSATRDADVCLAMGPLTTRRAKPAKPARLKAGKGRALLAIPGAGRYLVSGGREVLVAPEEDADPALVRLFILGSVLGLVCHQRGLLPLHASAVEIDGEAVAFVGDQGRGKSTLAAHCLDHGAARLVADDILVVSFDAAGRPWAQPGMPSVKLWRDALTALGRDVGSLRPDWLRADKFHLPASDRLVQAPVPLTRVYVLDEDDSAGAGRIEPIAGAAAAATLIAHTYRVEYLDAAEHRAGHFRASARLARSVAVRRLVRCRDLAQVGATVAVVLAEARARAGIVG
jgi:hypothetical protein